MCSKTPVMKDVKPLKGFVLYAHDLAKEFQDDLKATGSWPLPPMPCSDDLKFRSKFRSKFRFVLFSSLASSGKVAE